VVDAYEPQIRALLAEWPKMPGPVIAARIGWPYSEGPLKKLLACGVPNSARPGRLRFYAACSYSVIRPSEDGPAPGALVGLIGGWTVGSHRLKIEGPVRTSAVVMTDVLVKCPAEVPFAKDQHAVGDLAPDGEHEPLRVRVRPRAAGWDLAHGDAGIGQYGLERIGELARLVTDQDRELVGPVAEIHEQVSGCWAVHGPSGL